MNLTRFVYACCQNGSLPSPEQVVQKRCDVVGQRVGVQIVVQRVVAVVGIQADFDVVVRRGRGLEESSLTLWQKSPLTSSTSPPMPLADHALVGDQLLGIWIHAAAGLAGADGAEDGDAGEKSALGNRQANRDRRWNCFLGL